MNHWQKAALLGLVLAVVFYALRFVPRDPRTDLGQYELPSTAAKVCMASLLPSLFVGWFYQQRVLKSKRFLPAMLITVVMCVGLFLAIVRLIMHDWYWARLPWVYGFPAVMCGVPLIYLGFSSPKLLNQATEPASPSRGGST